MEDFNLFEQGPNSTQRKHAVEDARYGFEKHGGHKSINVGEPERWISATGGAGMILYGLKTRGIMGMTLGALGAALMYRGMSGHCSAYQAMGMSTAEEDRSRASLDQGTKIEKSIFVSADQVTLFQFWRNLSNLPQVMRHLKSVEEKDEKRSHWVATGPLGTSVEWDAEIINERPNELIAWRSLEGSTVDNAGSVRFTGDGSGGTTIKVSLLYHPPAGKLGKIVSSMLGEDPEAQIEEDLQKFKRDAEAGKFNGAAIGG